MVASFHSGSSEGDPIISINIYGAIRKFNAGCKPWPAWERRQFFLEAGSVAAGDGLNSKCFGPIGEMGLSLEEPGAKLHRPPGFVIP
jgi:hypothetical protein